MSSMYDTIRACIFGHAVGDALGVPVEFQKRSELAMDPVIDMRGYGTYPVPAGSWSDDTSMTLCALDSLAGGTIDHDAIMQNFVSWYTEGEFTPTGKVFDIGMTCLDAIDNYRRGNTAPLDCGLRELNTCGNGSLMRVIPFILYALYTQPDCDMKTLCKITAEGSMLTHAHPRAVIGCEIYAVILASIIKNHSLGHIQKDLNAYKKLRVGNRELSTYEAVLDGTVKDLKIDEIRGKGYILDSLEAALWCLYNTNSYSVCVLTAVNLGDDTDTTAAIAGGLAGALYGYDAIPEDWISGLIKSDMIDGLCKKAADNWMALTKNA